MASSREGANSRGLFFSIGGSLGLGVNDGGKGSAHIVAAEPTTKTEQISATRRVPEAWPWG
eukprot:4706656-Prymnesium_polylepis.3